MKLTNALERRMLRLHLANTPKLEALAMLKPRLLAALAQILMVGVLLNLSPVTALMLSTTCTGSDPCYACKNCKYCKHCAKDGGKCGVCK
jgi:hypothetical protein